MADTTSDNVKLIAPHLSGVSDELFALILADVAKQVTSARYGADQEEAQRNLAAHLLTMIDNSVDGGATVIEEEVDEVRVKYGTLQGIKDTTRYDATTWGQRYMQLRKGRITAVRAVNPL